MSATQRSPKNNVKINLNITTNLIQAGRLLKGTKLSFWTTSLAWVGMAAVILGVGWVISLVIPEAIAFNHFTLLAFTWIVIMLTAPLFAGMNMVAIKRVRNEPVNIRTGFQYFNQWLPLALAFLVISLITATIIALVTLLTDQARNHWLLIIAMTLFSTLIFNLTYALLIFIIPLIADRKIAVFQALKISVQTAKTHWIKLFNLLIIFYALNFLALLLCEIPFIGLICYIVINIWLIPFIFLNIGVVYHQLIDREKSMRSHFCQEINASFIGKEIKLCGWVHRRRDHGGLVFIDLRDGSGIVQVVSPPELAQPLRNEYVIQVLGVVRRRPEGTTNPQLASGEVEIEVREINIFNSSIPVPFPIEDEYTRSGGRSAAASPIPGSAPSRDGEKIPPASSDYTVCTRFYEPASLPGN